MSVVEKNTYYLSEKDVEELLKLVKNKNKKDVQNLLSKRKTIEYSIPEDEYSLSYFPVKFKKLEEMYEKQLNVFWTSSDITFTEKDKEQWDDLDEESRNYVTFILCLFAQLDGVVGKNMSIFTKDTSFIKECSWFYSIQNAIEVVHNKVYSLFLKHFITDPVQLSKCLNSIKNIPEIGKIAEWTEKWMDPTLPILKRIIAFVVLEGVIFSSAFACIYWIKRRGKLQCLTKGNEWIARDERLHAEFGIDLYKLLTEIFSSAFERLSEEEVKEIITSGVELNRQFTAAAIRTDLMDLGVNDIMGYVESVADNISVKLGYNKIYNTINPLPWMVIIGLTGKTNFFEEKVSQYGRTQSIEGNKFDPDFKKF